MVADDAFYCFVSVFGHVAVGVVFIVVISTDCKSAPSGVAIITDCKSALSGIKSTCLIQRLFEMLPQKYIPKSNND